LFSLWLYSPLDLGRFFSFLNLYTVGKLHDDELHNLYSSPIRMIKTRRMRWARHVAQIGANRNVYRILVGKPEGKSPLGRHRHRWVDNIKMNLRERGTSGGLL
jgi:hypothetical protein